ncbi:hypothetical protein NLU13_8539 [Sarocladium strictum]|uniref:Uncharacterized protein n=1 Tax=Sarocladium strictum TaxID=5046 RepID=A0AA39L531_SARSR|nr:hypothetical protein NLU13_8539 [Sarocladium strictum]
MSPSAKQPEICLDTISQLSAPLHETSSLTPLVHLLTLAYQVKIPPRSKQERLRTLLNTLSPPELSSSKHTDPQVRLGSYIRFLSPVLNGFAGMAEFEAAVGAFSKPGEFREFWELEGKNLITEFVSDGSSERMIVGSDVSFLEEFVRDATCRIGLTEKQRMLVLVPAESEVGDGIWEIPGEGDLVVKRGDGDEPQEIGRGYVELAIS